MTFTALSYRNIVRCPSRFFFIPQFLPQRAAFFFFYRKFGQKKGFISRVFLLFLCPKSQDKKKRASHLREITAIGIGCVHLTHWKTISFIFLRRAIRVEERLGVKIAAKARAHRTNEFSPKWEYFSRDSFTKEKLLPFCK